MTKKMSKILVMVLSIFCLMLGINAHAAQNNRIALISQMNGPSYANDLAIKQHLEDMGFKVEILDQVQDPKKIKQVDGIILSSTVGSKNLKPGWRELKIPLMTWESDYLDDLAMTGKRSGQDFGDTDKVRYLWMVNAPNPLSAGLPAGTINVYKKQSMMNWGKPGLGATIIATVYGEPEKAAIWSYEKGATMDYESLAPAKRLMFFLHNDTFLDLSADGIKLFDASVKWLVSP